MATVESVCEECEGKRFQASVLEQHARRPEHRRRFRDVGDRCAEYFDDGEARTPAAHTILGRLADVGLGYLSLGGAAHHAVRWRATASQASPPA